MTRPSLGETASVARVVARLHVDNASWFLKDVARKHGRLSPEAVVAEAVLKHEASALLATYGDDLDRVAGVPVERDS